MKKPMKKIKPRRFAEGGNTFSPEQEKFLGGADRTDPYILARMRKAVPDQAPVEDRIPTPVNQIKDEDSFEKVIKNAAVNDDGQVLENANKGKDLATSLRGENILKRMRDADNAPKAKKQEAPTAGSRGSVKPPYSNEGKNEIKPALKSGQDGPTADELDRYAADRKEAAYKKAGKRGADLIPTDGYADVSGGERVEDSSEFGRNFSNMLYAMGPGRLAGFGNAALEGAMALRAAKSAAAAKSAKSAAAAKSIKGRNIKDILADDTLDAGGKAMSKGRSTKDILKDDTLDEFGRAMKRGGQVKKMASGGSVSSRGDGIAQRGKTRGKMC